MERSKQELETLVSSQKEQLGRYEKRLKDVVTAYKGLLKEKEALETSLAAITVKDPKRNETKTDDSATDNEETATENKTEVTEKSEDQLQTQIITLMNSLATLSAEKSRMEASFQGDKKQLRSQLAQKDQKLSEMQTRLKEMEERGKISVEEVKAKWIVERQERERETNNQMVMIRELQKLYADERHLKENIEMQLNNFKTQFANTETESKRIQELQMQLRQAKDELKEYMDNGTSRSKQEAAAEAENVAVLKQVQQEMQQLKEQHAVAIKSEQRRVLHAEEQSRKQAALHEDRVANLEARLAELSNTVGSYDRLRAQDQDSIQLLKRKLTELELQAADSSRGSGKFGDGESQQRKHDMAAIVEEIMRLKKLLISENVRSSAPIDVNKIFAVGAADHVHCQEEINRLQQQVDSGQTIIQQLQENIQVQKSHIITLQEKVKVLNRNIDEQEIELKHQENKLRNAVQEERNKWKALTTDLENDHRCKVSDIEQQLQSQRQRSMQLLDEKEQEIKTLQTSFEVFHSAVTLPMVQEAHNGSAEHNASISSDAESSDGKMSQQPQKVAIKSKKLSIGDNCHMLHYANEIARKDIEVAGLRKSKYAAETALRKAIHDKVAAQEELSDKIELLEEQVDRLERCKTREGANLEYLKNVIISFIVTKDADGKQHMLKAISSVLQFTPNEIQTINAAFHKK